MSASESMCECMTSEGGALMGPRSDGGQCTTTVPAPADEEVAHGRVLARDVRRAELVDAAVRVIVRDGPHASMAQMAAEAGVSKPILYRYFCDRADLVDAVAEQTLAEVDVALARVSRGRGSVRCLVRSVIDTYLELIERNASVYRFLMSSATVETLDEQLILNRYVRATGARVAEVLGEALDHAGLDIGPSEVWGIGISGMVHTVGSWWLESNPTPRETVATYLTSLIVDGLPIRDMPRLASSTVDIGRDGLGDDRVPLTIGGAW